MNLFFKWAIPGLFLCISDLFKHKFYRKYIDVCGIRTRIVRVEGEHADHLTTTTAPTNEPLCHVLATTSFKKM